MSNINKILITVVVCVFIICVASVSIVGMVTSDSKQVTTTAPSTNLQAESTTEATTTAPAVSKPVAGTAQPTSAASTTTTAASTSSTSVPSSAAVTGNLSADILGKWTDSAGMSGYEFLEGGRVNMTYVDLAGFGVPFNGKASGLYTLEGDTLTVKFSIYSATIKKTYRVSVSENELSMFDLEEKETSTYARTVTQ